MTIYKDLKIGSSVNGTSQRYTYNITSSVSSVSGADANGNTLAYDSGFADVYLNGVRLSGADITITSGNSVSFASNLSNGDVVDIVAYGAFTVASVNADNLSSGTVPDARITGAYTGITGLDLTDNSKIRLGTGNDLEIYHDGSHSHIRDSGTGDLRLRSTFLRLLNASSEPYILCSSGGSVELYHNNSKKFETTSGGVAVTGDLTVDTDTLFVDSSNNKVGIGTTAPSAILHIDDSSGGFMKITRTGQSGGLFAETDGINAAIRSLSSTGSLKFQTNGNNERARFDASGNFFVGKTSSNTGTAGLELRATNQGVFTRSGGQPLILNRLTDDGRIINFKKDNVSVGDINVSGTGIGITLGGTGTANTLDDYEEGTWSPVVNGASGFSTGITSSSNSKYVKIGNIVTVQSYFQMGNSSGNLALEDNVTVTGLPFTAANTEASSCSVYRYNSNNGIFAVYLNATSSIFIRCQQVNGSAPRNGGAIALNYTYQTT